MVVMGNDQVAPVDLNAWLAQLGRHIAAVARHLGDSSLAAAAEARLLTSKECSGQQWDGPNCWPPLLHCLVEGCAGSGGQGSGQLRLLVFMPQAGS
ncbi:trehalase [Haematococcus lacustris]|uniref:alpha,alpha-trehalase n=1 Tax=Haematococcus lacustris TaxID=44745 RepID=A0A699ZM32_HAELA|nr:trehalase [Haematococcus lacustris]